MSPFIRYILVGCASSELFQREVFGEVIFSFVLEEISISCLPNREFFVMTDMSADVMYFSLVLRVRIEAADSSFNASVLME